MIHDIYYNMGPPEAVDREFVYIDPFVLFIGHHMLHRVSAAVPWGCQRLCERAGDAALGISRSKTEGLRGASKLPHPRLALEGRGAPLGAAHRPRGDA